MGSLVYGVRMTNVHLTAWLWCQLSVSTVYLNMLDYTDTVTIEHQESEGWNRETIIRTLEMIADKANEIASQVTRVERAPTANTARCISRMMSLGIKFGPALSAAAARIDAVLATKESEK